MFKQSVKVTNKLTTTHLTEESAAKHLAYLASCCSENEYGIDGLTTWWLSVSYKRNSDDTCMMEEF